MRNSYWVTALQRPWPHENHLHSSLRGQLLSFLSYSAFSSMHGPLSHPGVKDTESGAQPAGSDGGSTPDGGSLLRSSDSGGAVRQHWHLAERKVKLQLAVVDRFHSLHEAAGNAYIQPSRLTNVSEAVVLLDAC